MTARSVEDLELICSIADDLPVGVWVATVPEGVFVYANRAFSEIMAMDATDARAGDFSGPYGLRTRSGEPYPEGRLPFARVVRERTVLTVDDIVIHRRDGSRVLVSARARPRFDAQGELTHVVVAFRDITDEVHAEERRRLVEERLRHVVAHAPILLWAIDNAGIVTLSEGRGLEILGWRGEDFVGRSVFELYKDSPHAADHHRRALAGETVTSTASVGEICFESTLQPLRDATGAICDAIGVAIDVTQRQKMAARLAQAERLASMGRMAASLAHEINNPLAYVLVNLENLVRFETRRAESGLSPPLQTALKDALVGAERVGHIVRSLTLFARLEGPSLPVDLAATLRLALTTTRHQLRGIRVVQELGELPPVVGDEVRLGQVFVNLLVNAAQSMEDKVPSALRASPGEPLGAVRYEERGAHEVRVRAWHEDSDVYVEVSDMGCGIPLEIQDRVLDPFFTTKPVGVGTGLGLSVCHGIVKALGGDISIRSEVGQGTTVRVRLREATPGSDVPKPAMLVPVQRRAHVLIVDDDVLVAKSLQLMLESDHNVAVSSNALHALERISSGEAFDIIFCDLMMPVTTGMDLYQLLVERAPRQAASMVFMTGGALTAQARDFLERLPNANLLEKPFGFSTLNDAIRDMLDQGRDVPGGGG